MFSGLVDEITPSIGDTYLVYLFIFQNLLWCYFKKHDFAINKCYRIYLHCIELSAD